MRAAVVTDKELELRGLNLEEIYLIFAKSEKAGIVFFEINETLYLAQENIPAIKDAERFINKFNKIYKFLGVSVIFGEIEGEIERVTRKYGLDMVIIARRVNLENVLNLKIPLLFYKKDAPIEKVLLMVDKRECEKILKEIKYKKLLSTNGDATEGEKINVSSLEDLEGILDSMEIDLLVISRIMEREQIKELLRKIESNLLVF
ncbi:MAG: hypothetical protein QXE86_04670 [Archaeoglobaceae archaeon]